MPLSVSSLVKGGENLVGNALNTLGQSQYKPIQNPFPYSPLSSVITGGLNAVNQGINDVVSGGARLLYNPPQTTNPTATQPVTTTPQPVATPGLLSQTRLGQNPQTASTLGAVPSALMGLTSSQQQGQIPISPVYQNALNPMNQNIGNTVGQVPTQFTTPSGATIDANGNVINIGSQAQNAIDTSSAQAAGGNVNFPGLVSETANIAGGNLPIGQNANQIAQNYANQIAQVGKETAQGMGQLGSTGAVSPIALGRANQVGQLGSQEQATLAQAEQAALQGTGQQLQAQGQAQQGVGTAAGLAQPQANTAFFGNPLTGGLTGNGNQLLSNAVSQATQLIQNGADPNSPQIQSILSPFGTLGQQALTQSLQTATGGTYNPTASSAIAQENASLGQQYQSSASQLNTTLTQFSNVGGNLTSLFRQAGLNTNQYPTLNAAINAYKAEAVNPAAVSAMNAGLADLGSYLGGILGTNSSNLTPTEISSLVNNIQTGNLSGSQLNDLMQWIDAFGQSRLGPLQQMESGSYGGATGFTGNNAQVGQNPNAPTATTGPLTTNNPYIQGVVGGGLMLGGGVSGLLGNTASGVMSTAGSAVPGIATALFAS